MLQGFSNRSGFQLYIKERRFFMSSQLIALMGTAAGLGFIHTLIGPDHYLPFIVISKARGWSRGKTAVVTFLCGLGHVASSVVLGMVGIAAGLSLEWLVSTESNRGDIAAWLLTAFGLLYCIWGLRQAWLNRPHTHRHAHLAGSEHEHEHTHSSNHAHPHDQGKKNLTPWILFTIFVFGPCEPLIPLLMFPAAAESFWGVAAVAIVFSIVTIAMMMTIVLAGTFGLSFMKFKRFERFSHALAGGLILMCGLAIHMGL
jgi:ABC-type nickel/cobalt efflux system permease component RcnA